MSAFRPIFRVAFVLTIGAICVFNSSHALADPAKESDGPPAGVPSAIQGDYVGSLNGKKTAAHVVAVIGRKFRVILMEGGFPGSQSKSPARKYISAEWEQDRVVIKGAHLEGVADGRLMTLRSVTGEEVGRFKRVVRKSPTQGLAPPAGAVVLFSGKDSKQNWVKPRISADGHLLASNCSTRKKLGDHRLHIEFRIPFRPNLRGQRRGNSGVYMQSRYEIQILDSFGQLPGLASCGSLYRIRAPKVNMCFPPLVWQTYDVDFTAAVWEGDTKVQNARITVKHNGVTIYEDLELEEHTPGALREQPGPAPLLLQARGSEVVFQNIWAIEK